MRLPESLLQTGFDNGMFFITLVTRKRQCLFADPQNPYCLTEAGYIAQKYWRDIPRHFPHVALDAFIIMPDHIHGILLYTKKMATRSQLFSKSIAGSVYTVIKSYKSAVTKEYNHQIDAIGNTTWTRGFYSHRITSVTELKAIREYINNNPDRWMKKIK